MTKMTQRDLLEALVSRGDELLLSIARGEDATLQLEKRNRLAAVIRATKERLAPREESE